MTTYSKTSLSSEIKGEGPLSPGTLAFISERTKNKFYSFVIEAFAAAEKEGLTKAKLARRIRKKPEQLTRLLGAPGNWTIDTLAELMVGISRSEIVPASQDIIRKSHRNVRAIDLISDSIEIKSSSQSLKVAISRPAGTAKHMHVSEYSVVATVKHETWSYRK